MSRWKTLAIHLPSRREAIKHELSLTVFLTFALCHCSFQRGVRRLFVIHFLLRMGKGKREPNAWKGKNPMSGKGLGMDLLESDDDYFWNPNIKRKLRWKGSRITSDEQDKTSKKKEQERLVCM